MTENRERSDAYMMRFPDGMRNELKAAAAANNRSMNSEIIARLEASAPEQRSLRDWFAGQALASVEIWNPVSNESGQKASLQAVQLAKARWAYQMADALIQARGES